MTSSFLSGLNIRFLSPRMIRTLLSREWSRVGVCFCSHCWNFLSTVTGAYRFAFWIISLGPVSQWTHGPNGRSNDSEFESVWGGRSMGSTPLSGGKAHLQWLLLSNDTFHFWLNGFPRFEDLHLCIFIWKPNKNPGFTSSFLNIDFDNVPTLQV